MLVNVQFSNIRSVSSRPKFLSEAHECETDSEPSDRVAGNQHLEGIPLQVSPSCEGDDNIPTELSSDEEQCPTRETLSCALSDDDPSRPLPSDDHHTDRRTRLMRGPIQPRSFG
ncbi:hypothetical protein MTO96_041460 [Rhipicephalus appendiculatus]